jgi:hypothetical protein
MRERHRLFTPNKPVIFHFISYPCDPSAHLPQAQPTQHPCPRIQGAGQHQHAAGACHSKPDGPLQPGHFNLPFYSRDVEHLIGPSGFIARTFFLATARLDLAPGRGPPCRLSSRFGRFAGLTGFAGDGVIGEVYASSHPGPQMNRRDSCSQRGFEPALRGPPRLRTGSSRRAKQSWRASKRQPYPRILSTRSTRAASPIANCSLAAVTTWLGSNPNFFCNAFSGAEAPKVCMPMMRPVIPT